MLRLKFYAIIKRNMKDNYYERQLHYFQVHLLKPFPLKSFSISDIEREDPEKCQREEVQQYLDIASQYENFHFSEI